MTDQFAFKRSDYDAVFKELLSRMELETWQIAQGTWYYWHKKVKNLFLSGYLIKEINNAIDEAFEKKHWPLNQKFWDRVEDVVLKNRLEAQRYNPIKVDRGPESISGVLDRIMPKKPAS